MGRRRMTIVLVISLASTACERLLMPGTPENTPRQNFELLWQTLDQKYAYFQAKGIDWDSIYQVYAPRIDDQMHDTLLFNTLGDMILELKDAHTDLWSPFGSVHFEHAAGARENFNPFILQSRYYQDIQNRDGIHYKMMDDVGYMYVGSFSPDISAPAMREIMETFQSARGIIIDVRNNSGGNDVNAKTIFRQFISEEIHAHDVQLKNGPGHDDFITIHEYIRPEKGVYTGSTTVVLTNRRCYSACSFFVGWMSLLPQVYVVGDTTGGGGGIPHHSELPNGWTYRYSASRAYLPDGYDIDRGIPPDTLVSLRQRDINRFRDTMIEFALDYIRGEF